MRLLHSNVKTLDHWIMIFPPLCIWQWLQQNCTVCLRDFGEDITIILILKPRQKILLNLVVIIALESQITLWVAKKK